jgi:nucleotide-binding universal stress UspA family protein
MFQKILVALDCSDMGRPVFDTALALAKSTQARLLLVHVLSPLDAGYPSPLYPEAGAVYPTLYEESIKRRMQDWEIFKQQGLDYLRSCTNAAIAENVAVDSRQVMGDPGRQVCDLGLDWEADLIIVGRRGHLGLGEFFLGSVSNYVMHHAPCSVLTVQGETMVDTTAPHKESQMALQ